MATVQSLITSARYDLRDYGKGLIFDNAELVDYLNRLVPIMDSTLASLNSDLVEAEDSDLDTTDGQRYVDLSGLNSDLWDSLRSVWIDQDELTKISVDEMRRKRIWEGSNEGQPCYYALSNRLMLFEKYADDAYDLTIYYNAKTATLTLTSNMPYNSIFDQLFREMLVQHAKAKKEGQLMQTDAYFQSVFRTRALQENLRRNFIPPTYSKDF